MDRETDLAIADTTGSVQILSTAVFALIQTHPNKDVLRTVFDQIHRQLTDQVERFAAVGPGMKNTRATLQGIQKALGDAPNWGL